ncbi:hypothetical protein [Agathobacter sp.]
MDDTNSFIGYGIVSDVSSYDLCTMYYVLLDINGQKVKAQSTNYIYQKKRMYVGDKVRVRYSILKNGNVMCEILDEGLITCAESVRKNRPKYIIFCVIFFGLMIAAFIYDRYFMIK